MAVLPPFTLLTLVRSGSGIRGIRRNLLGAFLIATAAWGLIAVTGDPEQWIALGIGSYAAFSWGQALALRDPTTFGMMFRSKAFVYAVLGFPTISLVTYTIAFWTPPFFMRVHGVSIAEAGTVLGISAAIGGWLGITLGGIVSAWLKIRTGNARVYVGLGTVALSIPVVLGLLITENLIMAYVFNFAIAVFSSCWIGAAASTVNDLVIPRMRGIASAFYILMATVGLALGPYAVGEISDVLAVAGMDPGEALRRSMMMSIVLLVIPGAFLVLLLRHLIPEEANRLDRARAAGEPV